MAEYRPLFEHANDAIALVAFHDDVPVIEEANAVFRDRFVADDTEIVGKDLDEVVTADEQTDAARALSREARANEVVQRTLTRQTVDGPRDFYWQLVPVDGADEDAHAESDTDAATEAEADADADTDVGGAGVERAFTIYADLADWEQERERYRAFIERSTDLVTVLDTTGTYQYLSPSSERIIGYDPVELVGENAFDFVHADDHADVVATFADAVQDPAVTPVVKYRFRHADGSWVWLESRGNNQLDNPAIEGFVVNSHDVTDRVERERQLEASEQRYRRLVETAPTPIVIHSPDLELVYANDAAVDFLGAESQDDVLGTKAVRFIHGVTEESVVDRARALLDADKSVPAVEDTIVDTNGEVKHAILAATPVLHDGEPAIQTVATDITAVKVREAELERKNERLDEFVSIVSHDLRNPLAVANAHRELAAEDCDSDHLEALERALDRMETLIDDLLSLARHGDDVRAVSALDLGTIAERCWETVATDDASLAVDDTTTIHADESRLKQLLENLFRNAVEHADATVTVRVGALDDGQGFYVEDDGPGIPADRRDQLFEYGTSTSHAGTSFGLAIVQQIAAAHGWTITATESTAGGARFELTDVRTG